jgi:FkbM family methyltransferase
MPDLKSIIHRALRAGGCDLLRYSPQIFYNLRRIAMIQRLAPACILDVGANGGLYRWEVRKDGYAGRIISFEPTTAAFRQLQRTCAAYRDWSCFQYAIGDFDGEIEIHISANSSFSSSILPMADRHLAVAPGSGYCATEMVPMRRLDSLAGELATGEGKLWLKVDVQGYEKQVLDGAPSFLRRAAAVEIELSLAPLYEGEALFPEMCNRLWADGFHLGTLGTGLTDLATGEVLTVDAVFIRPERPCVATFRDTEHHAGSPKDDSFKS